MISTGRIRPLAAAAAVPLAALAVGACGSGGDKATPSIAPPKTASGRQATVGVVSDGSLGKILVNSQGRTLYLFQKDNGDTSTCFGACAAQWPPLLAAGHSAVGGGLTSSKVGTTTRSDGKPQVTYNGHPLYTYAADQKAGQTNGQGLNAFGGGWFVLSAAGNKVAGKSPTGTSGY